MNLPVFDVLCGILTLVDDAFTKCKPSSWGGMIREPNGRRFTRLGPNEMESRPASPTWTELSAISLPTCPFSSKTFEFSMHQAGPAKGSFRRTFPGGASQITTHRELEACSLSIVFVSVMGFGEICFNLLWGLGPFDYETWGWHRLPQHQPNASQDASFDWGWPIAMPYVHILECSLK